MQTIGFWSVLEKKSACRSQIQRVISNRFPEQKLYFQSATKLQCSLHARLGSIVENHLLQNYHVQVL